VRPSATFTIPGEPAGKQRARSGNGRHYTPEKTVKYENLVKILAREAIGIYPPHEGPVTMRITAKYGLPKSAPKRLQQLIESGINVPCCKKPDWDNIGKIVSDAMNGIAYKDDSQVFDGQTLKYWSKTPEVIVSLVFHS
jgi:Holliday junction resolvase RusA-like endonuclease